MPRTLPWMNSGAVKKEKRSTPAPAKRASSPSDLVNSDLEDVHPGTPPPRQRPRNTSREPSTSPPPGPPPIETMRSGFTQDDIFRMVEDEFLSTAQTYTAHIHHAEYARLKKLHRSRGQMTLKELERATDGKTAQSRMLQVQREKEGNAKRQREGIRKINGGEEEEDEDEYLLDPQLKGLMTSSQTQNKTGNLAGLKGLERPKADTRAAAGLQRSPYRGNAKMRNVYDEDDAVFQGEKEPGPRGQKQLVVQPKGPNYDQDDEEADVMPKMEPVDDDQDQTDDDDLDAPVRVQKERLAVSKWADKVVASTSGRPSYVNNSRALDRTGGPVKAEPASSPDRFSARRPTRDTSPPNVRQYSAVKIKEEPSNTNASIRAASEVKATLARRKAERRAAEAKKLAKAKEVVVPTFLV
ncbi:hypothetical protein TI39_contig4120g00004 [Zymoseptoria brevis]|uniref:Uncharacterized protein n=1 Tax=Zymoseptoria brevis TaxID=1047168 RepID=A0A0F4GGF7_9PEZI|nr:hypothetical protein TI39_contig4120g00004 [Zymoseptoria brevis]